MSPVAEQLHVRNEFHVGDVYIPHAPAREKDPYSMLHVTRFSPEDIGGDTPEVLDNCAAVYFLSHEPTSPNDDPIDGIASVIIQEEGTIGVELDFPSTTDESSRRLFEKQTVDDIVENAGIARSRIFLLAPKICEEEIVARLKNEIANAA